MAKEMKASCRGGIASALLRILGCIALMTLFMTVALILEEAVWREGVSNAIWWADGRMTDTIKPFVENVLIVALIGTSLMLLTDRLSLSVFLMDAVLFVLGVVNRYKYELSGEVLKISDITCVGEATGILENYSLDIPMMLIPLAVMMLIVLPALAWGIRVGIRRFPLRLVSAALSLALFVSFINVMIPVAKEKAFFYKNQTMRTVYLRVGLPLALVFSNDFGLQKPDGYSEDSMTEALADWEEPETEVQTPDVFFIMSEALYDLAGTGKVALSEDPLAVFKQLQSDYWGGSLVVSQYGRGTSNTEYETLTGYRATDTAVTAYQNREIMPKGMTSIVSVFNENGYHTEASHPNGSHFYARDASFTAMGFDSMYFSDVLKTPTKEQKVGNLAMDSYYFDELIRLYEQRPKDQPYFMHAITIQNHAPYSGYDFQPKTVKVTRQSGMDDEQFHRIENYVNVLKESDRALVNFLEYLSGVDRPVIVVIYGDHSPNVGLFGLNAGNTASEQLMAYETPVLIWSNYGFEVPESVPKLMNTYRLGASLIHMLGMNKDPYYNYLAGNDLDAYCVNQTQGIYAEIDGETLIYDSPRIDEYETLMRAVHYDRVKGKRYTEKSKR